jgi:hypothetical protein
LINKSVILDLTCQQYDKTVTLKKNKVQPTGQEKKITGTEWQARNSSIGSRRQRSYGAGFPSDVFHDDVLDVEIFRVHHCWNACWHGYPPAIALIR